MGNYKNRLLFIIIIVSLYWAVLIGKYFSLQILDGEYYKKFAKKYYQKEETLEARRGTIFDRNMNKLAVDLTFYSFAADPKAVIQNQEVSDLFAQTFDIDKNSILEKLNKNGRFVWLKRNIDFKKASYIESFNLKGLIKFSHYQRKYPYSSIASQILGFTDIDNNGLSGIEKLYNQTLSGIQGKLIRESHNYKKGIPETDVPTQMPINGNDITLTIDLDYQIILEEELAKAIEKHDANGGTGIIMNPKSGEILAMASYPTFDANNYGKYDAYRRKNRAITDIYEPGSTFKIVMASAVLENNTLNPADVIFCENGKYKVYNKNFTDHKKYGNLTFREVIEHSSNIGTIKATENLDSGILFKYARDFGFGNETGIELIGEVKGILHPVNEWSGISKAEISIGYEVGVTPLQLICAYSAVANGGVLLKPLIIKRIADKDNKTIYKSNPEMIRRVISGSTSRLLLDFLEDAVNTGTGMTAKIDGLKIAGKTGTAQKIDSDNRYSKSEYYASFVGIYPSYDPEIVALIMIDTPKKGEYYGSLVAAPTFKNMLMEIQKLPGREQKLHYVNKKIISDDNNLIRMPDFRAVKKTDVEKIAKTKNLKLQFSGEGNLIVDQAPKPGETIDKNEYLTIILGNDLPDISKITVPKLVGLSLREALNKLYECKLDFEIEGSGKVISQSLEPLKVIDKTKKIKLVCKN